MRTKREAIIGRREQLDRLRFHLDDLERGVGSLVAITGEPGIGKTRLAEEAAAWAADRGFSVHWGRCRPTQGRPPYWPWAQIFRSMETDVALGADADANSGAERFSWFERLAAQIRAMADHRPRLLILDDVHWSDSPSLKFLDFLSYELAEMPTLVLVTYREVEVRNRESIAKDVAALVRRAEQLPLAGLANEDVQALIEAATGEPVAETLLTTLVERTEGNPLFVRELARLIGHDSSGRQPVPLGIRGAIRGRLDLLTRPARELLAPACVIGREFDLATLAALMGEGTESSELEELLRTSAALEIISPVGAAGRRFRFSHALVVDVIYEDLEPALRAQWHEALATRLPTDPALAAERAGEVAHHMLASGREDLRNRAIEWTERAATHAAGVYAYEEAVAYLEKVAELLVEEGSDATERRCEILLRLGEAQSRAGLAEASSQTLRRASDLARQLGAPSLLARAATALCAAGAAWTELGRSDHELVRVLREALVELPHDNVEDRARVMARLSTELIWSRDAGDGEALSARAVELARTHGDSSLLAYASMARVHWLSGPDSWQERSRLLTDILEATGGAGELAMNAWMWRLGDSLQSGDPVEADLCRRELIKTAGALRRSGDEWLIDAVRAQGAMLAGRFDEVEEIAGSMLANYPALRNVQDSAFALIFLVSWERGELEELAEGLLQDDSGIDLPLWHSVAALAAAETGRHEQARTILARLVGIEPPMKDLTWAMTQACLAEAAVRCGNLEQADRLYVRLVPYENRNVSAGPLHYFGPVNYFLGKLARMLGRNSSAIAHLEAAEVQADRLGSEPWRRRVNAALSELREALAEAELEASSAADGASDAESEVAGQGAGGSTVAQARLARTGDVWELTWRGRETRLTSLRGFFYLALLLERPGHEFHTLDLVGRVSGNASIAEGPLGPVIDEQARRDLKRRLLSIESDLEDAEHFGDTSRAAALAGEREEIGAHLASAMGLGGRDRPSGSGAERSRAAVTKALRSAIARIAEYEPEAADLLSRTVRTGAFCCFEPLEGFEVEWDVGGRR